MIISLSEGRKAMVGVREELVFGSRAKQKFMGRKESCEDKKFLLWK